MQAKEDGDRETKLVCSVDREIERGVVRAPLRALHPVDYAPALSVRSPLAANRDARVRKQFLDGIQFALSALMVPRTSVLGIQRSIDHLCAMFEDFPEQLRNEESIG